MRNISPNLRPNGGHKFTADSAMTKGAVVKPAKLKTCSNRFVLEQGDSETGHLTEFDQERFGVAEMIEISEEEVGTNTSAEDGYQSDWSLEECQQLMVR